MKLWVSTQNRDKLKEVKRIFRENAFKVELFSTLDLSKNINILEDRKTLKYNAIKKAKVLFDQVKDWTIADDTGLEVYSLQMRPGVLSSRYSGGGYRENRQKLLRELEGKKDRRARFKTVVALISPEGKIDTFEGVVEGVIVTEERGESGFGYDAIFMPSGFAKTFGEMGMVEKDLVSHRGRALRKLIEYLRGVAQLG